MSQVLDFISELVSPFTKYPLPIDNASETPPLIPFLLSNTASTTRDHLANERTFLSWLRLSIYMAVVSIAIIISFHLKNQPSPTEKKLALPFGLIFWLLSLACLGSGAANYFRTVRGYAAGRALVQSGWKTQVIFTIVATAIVAACILFISTNASTKSK